MPSFTTGYEGTKTMADEKHTALFAQLVIMFQGACMQHLGKIKNPTTDKIEKDLQQAQAMIDLLEMLRAKTRGNLSKEEESFVTNIVRELKLNYVDESAKQDDQKEEPS